MEQEQPARLNTDAHWKAIKHCAPFARSFEPCAEEEGKFKLFETSPESTYATATELKRKHAESVCTKWVGKNGTKEEADVKQMHLCVERAFPLIAPLRAPKKYALFASEGDPKEDSSCFMKGLWDDINQSIAQEREHSGPETYVLVVRGEQDKFSKLFVEGWLDLIKELDIADRVFFAVLGEKGDNKSKSEFTYGLSHVIVNIGSTYKDAGFRYKLDSDGKIKVDENGKMEPTAGFKELCSLVVTPGVEELFIADKPKGLCVLTHVHLPIIEELTIIAESQVRMRVAAKASGAAEAGCSSGSARMPRMRAGWEASSSSALSRSV
jgi:hypothetical protein